MYRYTIKEQNELNKQLLEVCYRARYTDSSITFSKIQELVEKVQM